MRFDLGWVLVILLAVFAVAPLTYPGFFQVHSGYLSPFNVEHLSSAPNWGRAADLLRGEGKLPYLLVWPFFQGSGSGVIAIKWGYALAFVLGALGVYAWTRHWLGARGAVLASIVYTYLPWHLSTVYVRGAYAEAWIWAFWPFVFWAIDRWVRGRYLVAVVVGLPVVAASLWTQPGLFVISVPLLVAYGVVLAARRRWLAVHLVGALALTWLLLWFAARNVVPSAIPFAEHFLYPFQLLSAVWGDGLSFQVGLAGVGLSIVAVALWVSNRPGDSDKPEKVAGIGEAPPELFDRVFWYWGVVLLVVVLLALPISTLFWQVTGFDTFLTYPWQVLALAGLPLAFLSGSGVRLDRRLANLPAWSGMIAFILLASYPCLAPRFTRVDPGPEPVAMFQAAEAKAPQLMILDYDMTSPTEITPTMTVTLTWQAVEPLAEDYTIFLHALAEGDEKAAQRDTRPCDGECPTNAWQPGDILVDRYELDLSPGVPPGPYQLAVGLYLLDTGERATVVGRDDKTVFLHVP